MITGVCIFIIGLAAGIILGVFFGYLIATHPPKEN